MTTARDSRPAGAAQQRRRKPARGSAARGLRAAFARGAARAAAGAPGRRPRPRLRRLLLDAPSTPPTMPRPRANAAPNARSKALREPGDALRVRSRVQQGSDALRGRDADDRARGVQRLHLRRRRRRPPPAARSPSRSPPSRSAARRARASPATIPRARARRRPRSRRSSSRRRSPRRRAAAARTTPAPAASGGLAAPRQAVGAVGLIGRREVRVEQQLPGWG